MGQNCEGKPRGSFYLPLPESSSGELWTEFHKTPRCNSVSQREPPTADTLLTSAALASDTSPVPLLPPRSGRKRAKFSLADLPRRETHSFKIGQSVDPDDNFLGNELLSIQAQISLGAVSGRHFYPGVYSLWAWTGSTGRTTMQLSCVFLCVHSHTHKNQGWTWNMISESHHLPLLSLTKVKY